MKRKHFVLLAVAALICLLGTAALAQEKTVQGRCVGFDKAKSVVTFVRDAKNDPQSPDYQLPPLSFSLAPDMGPAPKAGNRMKIDLKKNQIILYNEASKDFKTFTYTLVEQKEGIEADNPLVAGIKLPAVDKEKKTVTLYSKRQKSLTVLTPPAEFLSLPDSAWDSGDEVRVVYAEEGKALKFENLSKAAK